MLELWGQLCDCICRPPRDQYSAEQLIGGLHGRFRIGRFRGRRDDVTLTNKKGLKLVCSHFVPEDARGKDGRLPCVIYCHCNSGSRRDAEEAVWILLPLGVSVFTLDFAGSGLSEGNYVTLGANEVDDVEVVVEHLRSAQRVSTVGLWGRSMGAVTALLYSRRDPSIAGLVVDSPFSRLTDLMQEIVEEQKLPIPRALFKVAVSAMKRSVRKKAGFDLDKVAPIDVVTEAFIPALFGHATEDSFIKIAHSEKLYEAYAGDKNMIRFEGDHNSRRPEFFHSSVSVFFHNTLQLDRVLEGGNVLDAELRRALAGAVQLPLATGDDDGDADSSDADGQFSRHGEPPYATSEQSAPREMLDAWGATARGLLRDGTAEALADNGGGGYNDDDADDSGDDAALMAAIQMSLLEAAAAGSRDDANAAAVAAAAAGADGAAAGQVTRLTAGASQSTSGGAAAAAAQAAAAEAESAKAGGAPSNQRTQSYVDQLCEALGDGLSAVAAAAAAETDAKRSSDGAS